MQENFYVSHNVRIYISSIKKNLIFNSLQKNSMLLSKQSMNSISSQVHYKRNCIQPFSKEKIRILRECMYYKIDYKFKNHFKLNVHKKIYLDYDGKRVVTLEGLDVYLSTWIHIMSVSDNLLSLYWICNGW